MVLRFFVRLLIETYYRVQNRGGERGSLSEYRGWNLSERQRAPPGEEKPLPAPWTVPARWEFSHLQFRQCAIWAILPNGSLTVLIYFSSKSKLV